MRSRISLIGVVQIYGSISVLQQVAAIKGAINGLMNELIELHLREHVLGDTEEIKEKELNEFLALVKRYL